MIKYIIVKYASMHFPSGASLIENAVHPNSYTAKQCGIDEMFFTDQEKANIALKKMQEYNPTVDYGIVRLIEKNIDRGICL